MKVTCNVCGCSDFVDFNGRARMMCRNCRSLERTRSLQIVLFGRKLIKAGARVLHLAPELGIAHNILAVQGVDYQPCDLDPQHYENRKLNVRMFDLTTDAEQLQSGTYDLVIHSHVMEHILCDVTAVLFHLHRSLKPDGVHVFSIPILQGHYAEDLSPLTDQERAERFGQWDHVRRFGRADLHMTIGKVFRLPETYDLQREFGADRLNAANIPPVAWHGFTSHTIFTMRKNDLLLC